MTGVWQATIVDAQGNVLSGATVEVRHETSGALATIHGTWDHVNDVLSDQLSNPITTGSSGAVRFYAANGLYRILATKGEFSREWRHVAIGLTITSDIAIDLEDIATELEDQAQEIADSVADISRTGEVALHNLWRLFRIGRPIDTYSQFELATRSLVLPSGVTLQTHIDTIETDTLLLGQTVSLLGAKNESSTAFVLETATVKIDSDGGVTLAEKFTELDAVVEDIGDFDFDAVATAVDSLTTQVNELDGEVEVIAGDVSLLDSRLTDAEGDVVAAASAASAVNTRVSTLDGAVSSSASALQTLHSTVTTTAGDLGTAQVTISAHTSAIANAEGDIDDLEARYGVSLNVNGYITGFAQNNDGSTGTFDILTDKFRIVDPASGGQNPTQVFTISGGNVHLQNLFVSGSLLVDGTIGATKLNVSTLSAISANVGHLTGGTFDFNGGGANGRVAFDGTNVTLQGKVILPGAFTSPGAVSADLVGHDIGRHAETSPAQATSTSTWTSFSTFTLRGTGVVAIRVTYDLDVVALTGSGDNLLPMTQPIGVRVLVNGSEAAASSIEGNADIDNGLTYFYTITVTDPSHVVEIQGRRGVGSRAVSGTYTVAPTGKAYAVYAINSYVDNS